jgi:hypothetical protein
MRPGISSYAFSWAVNAARFTPETLLDFAVAHCLPVIQFGDHVPLDRMERQLLTHLPSVREWWAWRSKLVRAVSNSNT